MTNNEQINAEGNQVAVEDVDTSNQKLFGFIPLTCVSPKTRKWLMRDQLLLGTVIGVALGLALGFALIDTDMPEWGNTLLGLPGRVFLRLLKMMVLPLIFGSITGGILSLRRMGGGDSSAIKKITKMSIGMYSLSYLLAVCVGLILVNTIEPGNYAQDNTETNSTRWQCQVTTGDSIASDAEDGDGTLDAVVNVLDGAAASNIVEAAADNNVLGIICFAIALACALTLGEPGEISPVERAFMGFNEAITKMVNWVLLVSPIGIFSLIAGKITAACNVYDMFSSLGYFIATVVAGLTIHAFICLPVMFFVITRRNPLMFYKAFSKALLTALAISSSAATLPITMANARSYGVREDLASFVLVLGATVNMDGTAMYEGVCALFIAQRNNVTMSVPKMIVIAITGSLAAVGAAAIPSAGLVTLIMVLQAVDLEEYAGDIALILVVDWFLDRLRTCVNVMGDGFVCCAIHHLTQEMDMADKIDPEVPSSESDAGAQENNPDAEAALQSEPIADH